MGDKTLLVFSLVPGRHYEAIASFYYNNDAWATPLGFRVTESEKVIIKVYSNTRTYSALTRGVDVVLNIARDPSLYLYTSFKNIYREWRRVIQFEKGVKVDAPRIVNAEAYIELKPTCIQYEVDHVKITYNIVGIYPGKPRLEPHSRCIGHIIDTIIYLTKIRDVRDVKLREKYRLMLALSLELVRKTCDPNLFNIVNEIENIYRRLTGDMEVPGPR